jgi:hypothetical protein
MVAEGDDLSPRWALMRDFADEVTSTGYEYRPISQNSNSFVGGALQRAGFLGPGNEFPERFNRQLVFDPVSGGTRSFYVPGFEAPLTNPINTATPMPFPLDAPTAPLVPTNGVAPPDRRRFLDNGFGNSGPILASAQGAPADKQARYLSRRTYGLSPAFDASAPAVPLASPDGITGGPNSAPSSVPQPPKDLGPLSLMDAYLLYRKRLGVNAPQASTMDAGAPAAPPSDDSNFSGGLLGRLAERMGVDPQNPDKLAPPPQDNELRAFYRDNLAQPWTLQRWR